MSRDWGMGAADAAGTTGAATGILGLAMGAAKKSSRFAGPEGIGAETGATGAGGTTGAAETTGAGAETSFGAAMGGPPGLSTSPSTSRVSDEEASGVERDPAILNVGLGVGPALNRG